MIFIFYPGSYRLWEKQRLALGLVSYLHYIKNAAMLHSKTRNFTVHQLLSKEKPFHLLYHMKQAIICFAVDSILPSAWKPFLFVCMEKVQVREIRFYNRQCSFLFSCFQRRSRVLNVISLYLLCYIEYRCRPMQKYVCKISM